jgi:broad specificity phosphatase PhoE
MVKLNGIERLASMTLVFLTLCAGGLAQDGAKIYYVRHAETMGNVTHNYTEENQCTFSDYGKSQVAGIAEKLGQYEFDYIAVSPTWRTRQTVLPYLKSNDLVGIIWPEIEEGGCDLRGEVAPAEELPWGAAIEIQPENSRWLVIRDEDTTRRYEPQNDAESLAVYMRGVDMLKEQFGGTGKRVLLVSHSCTGSRLFELFLGIKPRGRFAPGNAAVTLLEEDANGVYHLVQFNDEPFEQTYFWEGPFVADDFLATRNVSMVFKAQYFGEASSEPYHVKWKIRDEAGNVLQQGSEDFTLTENTEGELAEIQIDTHDIAPGTTVEIESRLTHDGQLLCAGVDSMVVPDYYSLAGKWHINAGDDEAWAAIDLDDSQWKSTEVPGGWESDALPDYDGIAWYRHRFAVPAEYRELWGDKPLAIALGAIDDADVTYLNGERIGQSGRFPPDEKTAFDEMRVYPFDAELLSDEANVLAVQVNDWMGGGGIWKGPVAIGPEATLEKIKEKR